MRFTNNKNCTLFDSDLICGALYKLSDYPLGVNDLKWDVEFGVWLNTQVKRLSAAESTC